MSKLSPIKTTTSAAVSLLVAASLIAPLTSFSPASAQIFRGTKKTTIRYNQQAIVPSGTTIPLKYDKAEKVLVTKDETSPITLTVAANVRTRNGEILIPYNSEIIGQIEPAGNGSRFVAKEIVTPNGRRQSISAASRIVTKTEKISEGASTGDILQGAAIGAAAASVIAAVTGDTAIATEEILGGAGLGALGGWLLGGGEKELISIDPNRDLNITLNSDLALR
jgi:hypothetical protein